MRVTASAELLNVSTRIGAETSHAETSRTVAAYHLAMEPDNRGETDESGEPAELIDRDEEGLAEDTEDPGDDVGTV